MITFNEYYSFLEKQATLSNFYYEEFENLAKSAKYMRCNKVVKKYQKDLERKKTASFNILNDIFKEEQKKKGVTAIVKINKQKDNKLKLFFRKLFGIKAPVITGVIEEFSETSKSEIPGGWKERPDIVVSDNFENDFEEDDWEEDAEDFFDDDKIEGQMDIEELNEGDVYEKKEN